MLLINPNTPWKSYCFNRYSPLGLAYLAAVLKSAGHPVDVIDLQFTPRYGKAIDSKIGNHRTVGITGNIITFEVSRKIARYIRERYPDRTIVAGGPYVSSVYESLIPDYADIAVIGEGEETLRELIVHRKDLDKIKGIAYRDGDLKVNPPRPPIENLDELPFPDWKSVHYREAVTTVYRKRPIVIMQTSRGCPYRCLNCTHIVHGYKLRMRSVHSVIGELEYLTDELGVREVHFWDDNFNFFPERVKEICREIIDRGISVHMRFPNAVRGDRWDDEMFELLKEAGAYSVTIAFESGVQEVVDKLGKKLDLQKAAGAVESAAKAGLVVNAYFMLGLPHDTPETMEKTINFAGGLKLNRIQYFVTMPFPGTPMYRFALKHGKLYDTKYRGYFTGSAPYEAPGFKREDVEKAFKRARRQMYWSPRSARGKISAYVKYPELAFNNFKLKVSLKCRRMLDLATRAGSKI